MTKRRQTQVVTGALVAAGLAWGLWRSDLGSKSGDTATAVSAGRSVAAPGDEPQSAIYAMLDAARDGDLDGYVACYSGDLRRQLEQNRQEMGEEEFRRYLAERDDAIKGVALMAPTELPGERAQIDMEYVYQGYNEAQTVHLARSSGRWTIERVDQAQVRQQAVPYGTPVAGSAPSSEEAEN